MIDREQERPATLPYEYRRVGGWSGTAAAAAPPPEKKEKKPRGAGSVIAVQSIACAVALLLALLLRTAGGEPYRQLCQSFQQSLMRNDLLATLSALWDGDPAADTAQQLESENAQAPAAESSSAGSESESTADGQTTPEGTTAMKLLVDRAARAPLAAGTLTSGYGYRENPTGEGTQFHRGMDIAAPAGTPIAAMFFGRISAAGENGSLGRYVCIAQGADVQVLYAHCQTVEVDVGAVVRAGETVARVGATGDATGNHVHIQISVGDTVYNPGGVVPVSRYMQAGDEVKNA